MRSAHLWLCLLPAEAAAAAASSSVVVGVEGERWGGEPSRQIFGGRSVKRTLLLFAAAPRFEWTRKKKGSHTGRTSDGGNAGGGHDGDAQGGEEKHATHHRRKRERCATRDQRGLESVSLCTRFSFCPVRGVCRVFSFVFAETLFIEKHVCLHIEQRLNLVV
jgi:hypothetical protein